MSVSLQRKDIALNAALNTVDVAKQFFQKMRSEENFDLFYDKTLATAQAQNAGLPELPHCRRGPSWIETGSDPHVFPSAKVYFRQMYIEACDLLYCELDLVKTYSCCYCY